MSEVTIEQVTQELEEQKIKVQELTDLVSDKEQAAQVSAKLAQDKEQELKALQEKFDALQAEADAAANEAFRLKEELAKRPLSADPQPAPGAEVATGQGCSVLLSVEGHIEQAIKGLEQRQAGEMACPEWREAKVSAEQAKSWCDTRTNTRKEQGIIDESKQHMPSIR